MLEYEGNDGALLSYLGLSNQAPPALDFSPIPQRNSIHRPGGVRHKEGSRAYAPASDMVRDCVKYTPLCPHRLPLVCLFQPSGWTDWAIGNTGLLPSL